MVYTLTTEQPHLFQHYKGMSGVYSKNLNTSFSKIITHKNNSDSFIHSINIYEHSFKF